MMDTDEQHHRQTQSSSQPYDNALKALMGEHAAEIIPQLVPEIEVIYEQNNEIKRENLRADLVYKTKVRGKDRTLNMELQTGPDSEMVHRMLRYHFELYLLYRRPVISVILYLFETSIPESPFRECEDEELLTFYYKVVALWTLDARTFVAQQVISIYPLLPGMKGANASLLIRVMMEMEQHYPRLEFARQLRRFTNILHRTKTVSEQDKQIVEEKMHEIQYDSLIDEDPVFQERLAKIKAESELEGAQNMVVDFVEARFPSLTDLAQQRVTSIRNKEMLSQLAKQVATAPDENALRWLLDSFAA
jgi:hypothetical protein